MRKLIYLTIVLVISIISCNTQGSKDYVTLSGKITNQNSDSLVIGRYFERPKTIKLAEDGTFTDSLKVGANNFYNVSHGNINWNMFLKNGMDQHITANAEKFRETLAYTGKGSENNNYRAKQRLYEYTAKELNFLEEDKNAFMVELENDIKNRLKIFEEYKNNLDSLIIKSQKRYLKQIREGHASLYNKIQKEVKEKKVFIGKPSPKFIDYKNHKGGTTSLDDLKGKYVYIDIWATWCGPCKMQIPYLKEIECKYHNKNIEFVSISVDKEKDYEKWKAMVTEKELGGVQLFADQDFKSDFIKKYQVKSIPQFILIDPDGKVVSAYAPRPSKPELLELFEKLEL